jgi:hypothetical protein
MRSLSKLFSCNINSFFIIAIVFYSGQKSIAWYYVSLLFAIFICIGGLAGIIGSLFVSVDTMMETEIKILIILRLGIQKICKSIQRYRLDQLFLIRTSLYCITHLHVSLFPTYY